MIGGSSVFVAARKRIEIKITQSKINKVKSRRGVRMRNREKYGYTVPFVHSMFGGSSVFVAAESVAKYDISAEHVESVDQSSGSDSSSDRSTEASTEADSVDTKRTQSNINKVNKVNEGGVNRSGVRMGNPDISKGNYVYTVPPPSIDVKFNMADVNGTMPSSFNNFNVTVNGTDGNVHGMLSNSSTIADSFANNIVNNSTLADSFAPTNSKTDELESGLNESMNHNDSRKVSEEASLNELNELNVRTISINSAGNHGNFSEATVVMTGSNKESKKISDHPAFRAGQREGINKNLNAELMRSQGFDISDLTNNSKSSTSVTGVTSNDGLANLKIPEWAVKGVAKDYWKKLPSGDKLNMNEYGKEGRLQWSDVLADERGWDMYNQMHDEF
jgi:hypothetical protein